MRRLIIITALILVAPSAFALSLTSGRSQATTAVRPELRAAPASSIITRTMATRSVSSTSLRDQSMLARVTVYWASGGKGSDHYTRQHKTATGLRLRTGHCAVDPRRIPYGSKIVLPDGAALAAVDTGTAVKSRKAARQSGRTADERSALVVDRFFETKRQALAWAKTHPLFMPVRVVSQNGLLVEQPNALLKITNRTPIRKALPVSSTPGRPELVASNQAAPKRIRR